MANFGDFNFNDDTPGPDTDPTPDPSISSNVDGRQNDVTNYPEPGEGDSFDSGYVSIWDNWSNPEEPGAQQDDVAPVVQKLYPKYPLFPYSASVVDFSYWGTLNELLLERRLLDTVELEEYIPDPGSLAERAMNYVSSSPDEDNPVLDRIIKALDKYPYDDPDPTGLLAFIARLAIPEVEKYIPEPGSLAEQALNYAAPDELELSNDILDRIAKTFDKYPYEDLDATGLLSFIERLKVLESYTFLPPQYEELDEVFIPHEGAVLDWLSDDDIDQILDTDDAESLENPTGIGEMFDSNVMADAFEGSIMDLMQNSILTNSFDDLEAADFLNLIEVALGSDDLNDYLTDVVQNSNLIEFQNESGLEDYDDLL